MREKAMAITSGDLKLEAVVGSPDSSDRPLPGVVICHPHPLGGGNMNNNLVLALYQALVESSCVALRFNFRGVGNSQGDHSEGKKEPEDAAASLNALKQQEGVDRNRLGMAGYSFGTGVILGSLARYTDVRAFALFSPPIRYLDSPGIEGDARPKLFVCGDRDFAITADSLEEKLKGFGPVAESRIVSGADHFWAGREAEAAQHAVQFFARTLGE